jgi:uncharacterized protein (TIGR02145 family)
MKYVYFFLFLCSCSLCFNGCKRDDVPSGDSSIFIESLSGFAQKGPYVNGSSVTLLELDETLAATGKSFETQIIDNSGLFNLSQFKLVSPYVMLKVDGYYFNELKGDRETSPLILYALCDLTDRSTVNVNLLTHVERQRIEVLIKGGLSFQDARDSAQQELLAVFDYTGSGTGAAETLDISKAGEANGMLLAISVILQGTHDAASLTEFLATFVADFQDNGQIDDEGIEKSLLSQANQLDTGLIRKNLDTRFKSLGISPEIPPFEKYIQQVCSQQPGLVLSYSTSRNILCEGGSSWNVDLNISGGTPPYTVAWSSGEHIEDRIGIPSGLYNVTVTDGLQQKGILSILLDSLPVPLQIALNPELSDCGESNGKITLDINGGEGPFICNWSNGSSNRDLTGVPKGIYEVTVTDKNGCSINMSGEVREGLLDIEGNVYGTVKIGDQAWMSEDLAVTQLNDNTPLLNVASDGSPYYVWYNNDPQTRWGTGAPNGALYNWAAVASDKLCPVGWHVPSDEEWKKLEMAIGLTRARVDSSGWRGEGFGYKLEYPARFFLYSPDANETGFSAVNGGLRLPSGSFDGNGFIGYYWSTTENGNSIIIRSFRGGDGKIERSINFSRDCAIAVRCLKN